MATVKRPKLNAKQFEGLLKQAHIASSLGIPISQVPKSGNVKGVSSPVLDSLKEQVERIVKNSFRSLLASDFPQFGNDSGMGREYDQPHLEFEHELETTKNSVELKTRIFMAEGSVPHKLFYMLDQGWAATYFDTSAPFPVKNYGDVQGNYRTAKDILDVAAEKKPFVRAQRGADGNVRHHDGDKWKWTANGTTTYPSQAIWVRYDKGQRPAFPGRGWSRLAATDLREQLNGYIVSQLKTFDWKINVDVKEFAGD